MTNLKCINFYKKTLAPLQMLTVVLNNFILICLEKKGVFTSRYPHARGWKEGQT